MSNFVGLKDFSNLLDNHRELNITKEMHTIFKLLNKIGKKTEMKNKVKNKRGRKKKGVK